jgi:hypothetical protein
MIKKPLPLRRRAVKHRYEINSADLNIETCIVPPPRMHYDTVSGLYSQDLGDI